MNTIEFKASELPSRSVTYPEGTVFTLNRFNYGEVQDLNSEELSLETKIEKFSKAITNNTGLPNGDITYIDYMYMHLGRTAGVYGNDMLQFPITCPHCENEVTEKIKFTDLEMNDISDIVDIMPLTFPINGEEYQFSFITLEKIVKWFRLVDDIQLNDIYVEVKKQHEEMKQEVDKITIDNPNEVLQARWEILHKKFNELNGRLTSKVRMKANKYKPYGFNALLLAFMCTDFGTDKFDKFLEGVNNVQNPEEIEFLQFVESKLGHGIEPIKFTCPHCAKIFVANIESIINDIYPFRTSSTNITNKLRALQKAKGTSEPVKE